MKSFKKIIFCTLVYVSIVSAQPPTVIITEVANGFNDGVGLANAGDGSNRMFIVKQNGEILIWTGSEVLSTPFINIQNLISTGGEQGLLGLAFHPDYVSNGYFYLNYTDTNGDTIVARFSVTNNNSNLADINSAMQIIKILQPGPNHNGGDMHFSTDGFLYISTGDGGTGGAEAQNINSLLGKILRIDVNSDDFPGDSNKNYAIPVLNPFSGATAGADEIWLLGLRNPWRFSFDRNNGDIIIGDVGEGAWEEVNFLSQASGGENFGWPCYEGADNYNLTGCGASSNYIFPVNSLSHGSPPNNNCSMIGGYKFRDPLYSVLNGWYFFSDWCTGTLWAADALNSNSWNTFNIASLGTFLVTGFGEGENGELYVMSSWSILHITTPISDLIFMNGFEN